MTPLEGHIINTQAEGHKQRKVPVLLNIRAWNTTVKFKGHLKAKQQAGQWKKTPQGIEMHF